MRWEGSGSVKQKETRALEHLIHAAAAYRDVMPTSSDVICCEFPHRFAAHCLRSASSFETVSPLECAQERVLLLPRSPRCLCASCSASVLRLLGLKTSLLMVSLVVSGSCDRNGLVECVAVALHCDGV